MNATTTDTAPARLARRAADEAELWGRAAGEAADRANAAREAGNDETAREFAALVSGCLLAAQRASEDAADQCGPDASDEAWAAADEANDAAVAAEIAWDSVAWAR